MHHSSRSIGYDNAIFIPRKYTGNVANLIEQIAVMAPHNQMDANDLPSHIRNRDTATHNSSPQNEWNLREATRNLEMDIITKALKRFGSQRKAAIPLGIDQSTLARKAKRYGIARDAVLHNDA